MRLIDADALRLKLKEDHDYVMHDPEVCNNIKWCEAVCFNRTIMEVHKAPTIDAVPVVHGRWEYFEIQSSGSLISKCSACGGGVNGRHVRYTYCPNCGAKMDK